MGLGLGDCASADSNLRSLASAEIRDLADGVGFVIMSSFAGTPHCHPARSPEYLEPGARFNIGSGSLCASRQAFEQRSFKEVKALQLWSRHVKWTSDHRPCITRSQLFIQATSLGIEGRTNRTAMLNFLRLWLRMLSAVRGKSLSLHTQGPGNGIPHQAEPANGFETLTSRHQQDPSGRPRDQKFHGETCGKHIRCKNHQYEAGPNFGHQTRTSQG